MKLYRSINIALICLYLLAYVYGLYVSTVHLHEVFAIFDHQYGDKVTYGLAASVEIATFLLSFSSAMFGQHLTRWMMGFSTFALIFVWGGNFYALHLAQPDMPLWLVLFVSCFFPVTTIFLSKAVGYHLKLLQNEQVFAPAHETRVVQARERDLVPLGAGEQEHQPDLLEVAPVSRQPEAVAPAVPAIPSPEPASLATPGELHPLNQDGKAAATVHHDQHIEEESEGDSEGKKRENSVSQPESRMEKFEENPQGVEAEKMNPALSELNEPNLLALLQGKKYTKEELLGMFVLQDQSMLTKLLVSLSQEGKIRRDANAWTIAG